MPIFVQWQWKEHTNTFLAIFHFWDDGRKSNLRIRTDSLGFETLTSLASERKEEFVVAVSLPSYLLPPARMDVFMTWAPSHPEFCFLTEVLTYANLINGLGEHEKRRLRPLLEGRGTQRIDQFEIDAELMESMPEGTMVVFTEGVCFEVCAKYIDYLKKLLTPYLKG